VNPSAVKKSTVRFRSLTGRLRKSCLGMGSN
jgi:hypothetical protein